MPSSILLVTLALACQAILLPTLAPVTFVRATLPAPIRLFGLVILALLNLALAATLVAMITGLPLALALPIGVAGSLVAGRLTRPLLLSIQAQASVAIFVRRLWRLPDTSEA